MNPSPILPAICVAFLCLAVPQGGHADDAEKKWQVASPGGQLQATFWLDERDQASFAAAFRGTTVATGTLGLDFAETGALGSNLQVTNVRRRSGDDSYQIPVGKASQARDRHEELVVSLQEQAAPGRKLEIALRAFDDGLAFRYSIPEQEPLATFTIADELTRIHLANDPKATYLPLKNHTTPYEWYYEEQRVSQIDSDRLLGLPLLLRSSENLWMAVTEANLTDYAGMYLSHVAAEPGTLRAKLSPLPGRQDGAKVIGQAPFASPWRVLQIADDPGRLLESNIGDRPIRDDEFLNMSLVLLLAGLDTVKSQLGYMFYHLATHPEDRQRIIDEPEIAAAAVEEFLRANAIVMDGRKLAQDVDFHGCPMKRGDMVMLTLAAASRDTTEFDHADQIDFDRKTVTHFSFGSGPHRCLGSHLARLELRIVLEEWHKRIPHYALDPAVAREDIVESGPQLGLSSLPLVWGI